MKDNVKYFLDIKPPCVGYVFESNLPFKLKEDVIEITKEQYTDLSNLRNKLLIDEANYSNLMFIRKAVRYSKHHKLMHETAVNINNICTDIINKNMLEECSF